MSKLKEFEVEKFIEKLKKNDCVKLLIDKVKKQDKHSYGTPKIILIGGAVIDVIENRKPKDYDLAHETSEKLIDDDFVFIYETSTAKTYKLNNHIVQILKRPQAEFEYKISQSSLKIMMDKAGEIVFTLTIHKDSFMNKQLIPVDFDNKNRVRSCLLRIPHWKKKGYMIKDETYLSLIRKAFQVTSINS